MEKGKCKVLVIEEDLFLANIYRAKLEQENFEVRIAHGGGQGLQAFDEFSPDIVLAEIVLAGTDGFSLLEELRGKGGRPFQFVFLTKLGEREDVTRGMQLGVDAYFIKTQVTFKEVVVKLKELAACL